MLIARPGYTERDSRIGISAASNPINESRSVYYTPSLCALGAAVYSLSAITQIQKILIKTMVSLITLGQLHRTRRLNSWTFSGAGKDIILLNTQLKKVRSYTKNFFKSCVQNIEVKFNEASYLQVIRNAISVPFKGRYHDYKMTLKEFFIQTQNEHGYRPRNHNMTWGSTDQNLLLK